MDKELNFICWLWTPLKGVTTTKKPYDYSGKDVNHLYTMLKRFYKKPFRLSCITDNPEEINPEINIIPIWNEFRRKGHCFSRLVAFKKGMDKLLGERFVSIDLDCVIVDDITSLFDRNEDFVIWSSGNPKNPYCGSLWMLKTNSRTKVYDTFNPDKWVPNRRDRFPCGSDQAQIAKACPGEATWKEEDGVYNYRYFRKDPLPDNARIVFFNGNFHPRQAYIQKDHPWIKKYYPDAATVSKTLNICCFYWQGDNKSGWNDPKLGTKYINYLYKGVRNNTNLPFTFFSFIQKDLPMKGVNKDIERISFDSPIWNKRLPKMKVFDKANGFDGRVVMLDIDILITGNIDAILSYDGPFMTRASFKHPERSGGDLVFFKGQEYSQFWDYINDRHPILEKCKGNERILYRRYFEDHPSEKIDYIQGLYPNQIFSYKRDVGIGKPIPEGCKILSCHGKPRLHRIENKWIRKLWK